MESESCESCEICGWGSYMENNHIIHCDLVKFCKYIDNLYFINDVSTNEDYIIEYKRKHTDDKWVRYIHT